MIPENIYVFGGQSFKSLTLYNIIILDTNDFTWSYDPDFNPLLKRRAYNATLLPNGMIVYIGGVELIDDDNFLVVNINQINLYDTKFNTWSVTVCIIIKYQFLISLI